MIDRLDPDTKTDEIVYLWKKVDELVDQVNKLSNGCPPHVRGSMVGGPAIAVYDTCKYKVRDKK
jgi:hypothetical protein